MYCMNERKANKVTKSGISYRVKMSEGVNTAVRGGEWGEGVLSGGSRRDLLRRGAVFF